MSGSITSADAVFMLTIPMVYSAPQQLQAFSADDMFSTDAIDPVELQMGVDGVLVGGWVPRERKQTIMFLASSPSIDIFETWAATNDAQRATYTATATISLKSLGRVYALTNGYLSTFTPMPNAKKVLQPRSFGITWQSIAVAPI
jgi:hypothetical protein